jgi:hypothetical protein
MTEINELHAKKIVKLTLTEFRTFVKTHQALLFPAFEMQRFVSFTVTVVVYLSTIGTFFCVFIGVVFVVVIFLIIFTTNFSIFILRALQKSTLGVSFWEKLSKRRVYLSKGEYLPVDEFVMKVSELLPFLCNIYLCLMSDHVCN